MLKRGRYVPDKGTYPLPQNNLENILPMESIKRVYHEQTLNIKLVLDFKLPASDW